MKYSQRISLSIDSDPEVCCPLQDLLYNLYILIFIPSSQLLKIVTNYSSFHTYFCTNTYYQILSKDIWLLFT